MRPKSSGSSNGPRTCSKRLKTSPEHAVALQEVDGTQPEACQSGALSQFEFPHFSAENNFLTQELLITNYILSYSLLKDLNRFNKDVFILYILSYSLLKDLNRFNKEQATNSKISNFIVLQSHHFFTENMK